MTKDYQPITVGDLRRALEDVPEDTRVIVLYDSFFGVRRAILAEFDDEFESRQYGGGPAFLVGAE